MTTRSELLQIRLTGGEKERLERQAYELGVSVSALVRARVFGPGESVQGLVLEAVSPTASGLVWKDFK